MAITTAAKEIWKVDKKILQKEIISLKKSMTDFKVERKSEWKSFKEKFNEDLAELEKSFKKLATLQKNKN
jgi:hypothetical protein